MAWMVEGSLPLGMLFNHKWTQHHWYQISMLDLSLGSNSILFLLEICVLTFCYSYFVCFTSKFSLFIMCRNTARSIQTTLVWFSNTRSFCLYFFQWSSKICLTFVLASTFLLIIERIFDTLPSSCQCLEYCRGIGYFLYLYDHTIWIWVNLIEVKCVENTLLKMGTQCKEFRDTFWRNLCKNIARKVSCNG